MKKHIVTGAMLFAQTCSVYAMDHTQEDATRGRSLMYEESECSVLTDKVLKLIDGKGFGVDGKLLKGILWVRARLVAMAYGKTTNGVTTGIFEYEEQLYSLTQLAALRGEEGRKAFYTLIGKVSNYFFETVDPLMANARGAKQHMLRLIMESCARHCKPRSPLLDWAQAPDGREREHFNKTTHNFEEFRAFVADLIVFLEDLVCSCPKAQQQLVDHLEITDQKAQYTKIFTSMLAKQKHKIKQAQGKA